MKIILLGASTLILLTMLLSGWWLLFNSSNAYIIGGAYAVHDGEEVKGDLNLIFAQVELEGGGRVDGRILSFSSALDLNGAVTGDILTIGSDVNVKESAQLKDRPRELDTFPYVILLPQMARIGTEPANKAISY